MSAPTDCACTGKSLPKLLRPAVMAFLAQGEAHGYQIAQHLAQMRMFADSRPDPPGVYRALKEMTEQGLVTASWETGDSGPAKRVFTLTQPGKVCLETWCDTLSIYRDAINELLNLLRKARRDAQP
ncbi:PadR family transcriptional regulator [Planctomycetales bacterium ZRK34]|nr:PadR family transcriptional regulator [Planctomycetales bacterium ZRK34]